MRYLVTIPSVLALVTLAACAGQEESAPSTGAESTTTTVTAEPSSSGPDEAAATSPEPAATQTATPEPDQDGATDTSEAAQFPDNPDEYVEAWVQAWASGDGQRAEELAAPAPSLLVQCLETTQGEWLLEDGMGDMAAFAGGEDLWWSTLRHEPTQAVMHVYSDQGLYGAEDAIVGADLTHDGGASPADEEWALPAIEDCFATELLPAVEAWGEGDAEPLTPWVAEEQRAALDDWQEAYSGTNATIVQLGSLQRYGSDSEDPEYQPSVSVTLEYDDGVDRPESLVLFQFRSDVLTETTKESLYRVTVDMIHRRFV